MSKLEDRLGEGGNAEPPDGEPASTSFFPLVVVAALLLALGIFGSWWTFLIVVSLLVCIFLHELGHFLTAKRAGMKVTEFFIGFGPRIWSFRRGEVEYGLKAVLLGAYVRIIGMNNLEEVPPEDEARTYRQKPYPSRLSVAVAGSAMHFFIALLLLGLTLGLFGVQRATAWRIGSLVSDSPAATAGLRPGDKITSINGQSVTTFDQLTNQIRSHPGETVTLTVVRPDGTTATLTPTLANHNSVGQAVGFLGIGEGRTYVRESPIGAVTGAFTEFGRVAGESVVGLSKVFSPEGVRGYIDALTNKPASSSAAGTSSDSARLITPVGVAKLKPNGAADFLLLMAVINISIGLLNLIPLLPFDGGHVAIATYEEIRSRITRRRYRADVAKMLPWSYVLLAVVFVFFSASLWLDLFHPVGG
jgi:membrane-associated protease RseP (regulator of RpoE activity)